MSPKSRSPSTSPAKNTPENYQSAAREIEQEKQMVAALKRLSIGHLMNLDPDIPASDASYSFLLDRELQGEAPNYPENPLAAKNAVDFDAAFAHPGGADDEERPASKPSSKNSSKHSSKQGSPEYTQPSSVGEESRDELLWVPANMHPEVNPQQFKTHVKTTIDELLERKLSRSKSASRSKRSSLSFSTSDEVNHREHWGNEDATGDASAAQYLEPRESADSAETSEIKARNRLSNPSLRKLTSELQTMSRLAGMDSNDAVTLARSLSTSSLGYSDVERTAMDEIEHANNFSLVDVGCEEPGDFVPGGSQYYAQGASQQYQNYPETNRRPRAESPYLYAQNEQGQKWTQGRGNDDFALRRSRRVDYRKGPSTSSSGSQLQNNKAGKLAQLRHNLSGSNLHAAGPDQGNRPLQHSTSRTSMQSINPRSSQVLFSYKVPSQNVPAGHTKSLSKHSSSLTPKQGSEMPLGGYSAKDSPYSSAMAPDTLGRNLHTTKYSQHNLTSKSLGSGSPPVPQTSTFKNNEPYARAGHRSTSREHEKGFQKQPYQNQHYDMRDAGWKSRGAHGHRQASPTSPVSTTMRIPSRDSPVQSPGQSPVQNQAPWPDQGRKRYVSPNSLSAAAPVKVQHPNIALSGERPDKAKSYNKRDKTRELNQNLDLLRNEINEFKERLATKVDPKSKPETSSQQDVSAKEAPADFSFDLTNQDVSYEDTLGIEGDVLADLESDDQRKNQPLAEGRNLSTFDDRKNDEIVSVPDSSDTESLTFRDTVAKITNSSRGKGDELAGEKPSQQQSMPVSTENKDVSTIHIEKRDPRRQELEVNDSTKPLGSTPASHYEPANRENHALSSESRHIFTASQEDLTQKNEVSRQSTVESSGSSDIQSIKVDSAKSKSEKKKPKKTWPWSKDKSDKSANAKKHTEEKHVPKEARSPVRSVSSPEITGSKRDNPKEDSKENSITKFFKKRRSSSVSHEKSNVEPFSAKRSSDSSENEVDHSYGRLRNKRLSKSSEISGSEDVSSQESSSRELKREKSNEEARQVDDQRVTSRIKNRIKNMKKINEEKEEKPEEPAPTVSEEPKNDENAKPRSTVEVQEKLKKSIKRYSRPNQPIEFTDSAFGFPLPPPSSSTLIMIDYRFPVHVERAIYRLSHLKLANPKRSLREQVILSNFMYAYLNLVDHTLHLEQQMTSDDYEVEQPEGDLDFLGEQDVDTEFEADDGFDESDFDSIKIDLDVKENQIRV